MSQSSFIPSVSEAEPAVAVATPAPLGYRPSLDGLRAVCVLSVIVFHSLLYFRVPFTELEFMQGGFLGVDGFFVLSGFLITSLLVEEWGLTKQISLRRFYLRRALRLLPALALMALGCAVYVVLRGNNWEGAPIWRGILAALAYYANFLVSAGKDLSMLLHTWSLSTEEQFYLVWPLALRAMLRAGWRRSAIIAVVVFGILAAAGWRAWLWMNEATIQRVFYAPDTRADALLVGCLFGLLWSWKLLPVTPRWRLIFRRLGVIALLYLGYRMLGTKVAMPQLYWGELTLIALAFALVILELVERPLKPLARALENRVMVWLGRVSYGLYLWHPPVIYIYWRVFGNHFGLKKAIMIMIEIITLLVVVSVSYYLVEQPCLRLKGKFGIKNSRPDAVPAANANVKPFLHI